MSENSQQSAVAEALRRVTLPGAERDVVSLGWLRHVGLGGGRAKVTFEVPRDALGDDGRRALEEATQDALRGVEGVRDVVVEIAVAPPLRATTGLPGVKHVIAVGAGKGGVGKSTVATLLAAGMQRRGLRVGLMDGDVYGPSLPMLTGTEDARPTADPDTGMIYPPEFSGIKIMSMGYIIPPGQAVVWRGPMAQKYVKEFLDRGVWGELDYLIVDLPPGTGDIPLTLAQSVPLTGAVIVCTPQDVALLDAVKALRMYEKLSVPTLGMIENMSYYCCPKCGHRDEIFGHGGVKRAAESLGAAYLGEIPLNLGIRAAGDAGQPFANFTQQEAPVVAAVENVVTRVIEEAEAQSKRRSSLPQLKISG